MKLGKALHLVRGVTDHDDTVDFYRTLGYTELETGTIPTKFTLFTDGRINFLISQDTMTYTGLIYFDDDQTPRVAQLEQEGISFFWKQEDEETGKIKQAMFEVIPEKFGINLVSHNYDTRSIPKRETTIPIGMFGELAIPVDDFDKTAEVLQRIGFEIKDRYEEPNVWGIAYDGHIALGIHQTDRISMNTPTYYATNSAEILQNLKEKEIDIEMFGDKNGVITAPDGQRIFIFHAPEEQLKMMRNFTA